MTLDAQPRQSRKKETGHGVGRNLSAVFSGYVFAFTGYGEAMRGYLHALHGAGVELSVENRSRHADIFVEDRLGRQLLDRPMDPDLYLCHTEPLDVPTQAERLNRTVAITTWEADRLPDRHVHALNRAREVWVPSRFNEMVFSQQLEVPVYRIPHTVRQMTCTKADVVELSEGLHLKDTDFVFLAVGTWQERKNLAGVIEAFLRAFPDDPGVVLVVKTLFSFVDKATATTEIGRAVEQAGCGHGPAVEQRIRICEGLWPQAKMDALTMRADCYVSLHRGEGWCYPLFDAVAQGKPVVATAYGGPLDYLSASQQGLVDWEPATPRDRGFAKLFHFSPDMQWAEPDLGQAAEQMRLMVQERLEQRRRSVAWAIEVQTQYAPERIGRMARQRLEEVLGRIG